MIVATQLNKIELYTYGEAYELTLGDIENATAGPIKIKVTERDFERLKVFFPHCEKHGKFNEHETYTI